MTTTQQIKNSKYWNEKYQNFDATTKEARDFLNSLTIDAESEDITILTGFIKVKNTFHKNASFSYIKENQHRYEAETETFKSFKMTPEEKEEISKESFADFLAIYEL
jgi:hypothetical protein